VILISYYLSGSHKSCAEETFIFNDSNYNSKALQTKNHATKILRRETVVKCEICQRNNETIDHIILACPILANEQHIMIECAQLHFTICKEINVKLENEHWYEHVPKLLERSHEGKVTTLCNQQV
jgi:hypothetical protein